MKVTVIGGGSTYTPELVNGFLAHVDCTGCHVKPRAPSMKPESGAMVMAATPESCDKCHQAGYGAKMVPLWQTSTRKLFDHSEGDLASAKAGGVSEDALADVQTILNLIKTDGSWGVHNPRRTQQLLETARTKLKGTVPTPEVTP